MNSHTANAENYNVVNKLPNSCIFLQ